MEVFNSALPDFLMNSSYLMTQERGNMVFPLLRHGVSKNSRISSVPIQTDERKGLHKT